MMPWDALKKDGSVENAPYAAIGHAKGVLGNRWQ